MKCKCKKIARNGNQSYRPVIQTLPTEQHEPGKNMCAAMAVFFPLRKLINFTMSLEWNMLIKRAHWAFYLPKCACMNLA